MNQTAKFKFNLAFNSLSTYLKDKFENNPLPGFEYTAVDGVYARSVTVSKKSVYLVINLELELDNDGREVPAIVLWSDMKLSYDNGQYRLWLSWNEETRMEWVEAAVKKEIDAWFKEIKRRRPWKR